jgi:rod shape determining protein RodA
LFFSKRGAFVFWSLFVLNIGVGVLAPFIWNKLRGYQQDRVLAFLGLLSDPLGVGYQIIQSKVAIGSGGIFGAGWLQGTQTHLRFLPAQHTDFIFSVLAEEWGFIGSIIVLITFFLFLQRSAYLASIMKSPFYCLTAVGIVTIIAFQVFISIGMAIGIMPVTGIPLPFISYGGSSMIANMFMVGILLNISKRRFT